MNKEETPDVKELTEQEIEMKIWLIPEEENIQGVCEDVAKWAKSRCDEYWKSVIEQKDQEQEKAKLELIEFAYSERDTIVSLQKEVESLTSKLFKKDQEIAELKAEIQSILNAIAKGDELFKGLNFKQ